MHLLYPAFAAARGQGGGGGGKATLFDDDEGDNEGEVTAVTVSDMMKRLSVTSVLGNGQEQDVLGDSLGVDIDALAAAAAAAALPAKQAASPAVAKPAKSSGAAAAAVAIQHLHGPISCDCLTPFAAGKKKSAGSLFQDVDDSQLF